MSRFLNYWHHQLLPSPVKLLLRKDSLWTRLYSITLAYTGISVGELVALKWSDIDFTKQTIRITKTYKNVGNNTLKYQLEPPKTKKSRREVVVDELVINTLLKYKETQDKLIQRLGNSYPDQGFVFANVHRHPGYPVLIKVVETRMARLLKKVDLNQELTPHSLRHPYFPSCRSWRGNRRDYDRLGHQDDEVTR
ncbi:tyrosine-type recombinase/integrase [Bacillus sp. Bva_UNVM-123]|uniref:tyrosine-type recombinase/integrase n=1 Tax=Bacillus sp. Bva_UNVM-123 TaxID=2829798 RepID=UPI00391F07F8